MSRFKRISRFWRIWTHCCKNCNQLSYRNINTEWLLVFWRLFSTCKTQNTEHYWWTVVTRTSSGWSAFHLTNLECWPNNWERLLTIISAGELCAHGRRWSPVRCLENEWLVWGTRGASAHTAPLLTGDLQWASQRGQIFSKWAVKHRGVLPLWNMVAVIKWAMREVLTVVRWVDGASQEGRSKRIIWGGNVFVSNNWNHVSQLQACFLHSTSGVLCALCWSHRGHTRLSELHMYFVWYASISAWRN